LCNYKRKWCWRYDWYAENNVKTNFEHRNMCLLHRLAEGIGQWKLDEIKEECYRLGRNKIGLQIVQYMDQSVKGPLDQGDTRTSKIGR